MFIIWWMECKLTVGTWLVRIIHIKVESLQINGTTFNTWGNRIYYFKINPSVKVEAEGRSKDFISLAIFFSSAVPSTWYLISCIFLEAIIAFSALFDFPGTRQYFILAPSLETIVLHGKLTPWHLSMQKDAVKDTETCLSALIEALPEPIPYKDKKMLLPSSL